VKEDKSTMSAEMKSMSTAIHTRQDYKTIEDILSELKINPAAKKIQNYRTKWKQHVQQMDTDNQTTTLNNVTSTTWETNLRTITQNTSKPLKEPAQVTRPKTLQAI
jgi:hypothetical protein